MGDNAHQSIPATLKHVVEAISSYHCVAKDCGPSLEHDVVILKVIWKVQLGSRDVAKRSNAIGIRDREEVTFKISTDFPVSAPEIYLRSDFPRNYVPHINPTPAGSPVSPCISEQGLRDLILQEGISGMLKHLQRWLDGAAQMNLIDPQQGWEPVMFHNSAGIFTDDQGLVSNGYRNSSFKNKMKFSTLWCSREEQYGGLRIFVSKLEEKRTQTSSVPVLMITVPKGEKSSRFQNTPVTSRRELYEFLLSVGLSDNDLNTVRNYLRELFTRGNHRCIFIGGVKRPFKIIGSDADIEILPFDVVLAEKNEQRAKVRPLTFQVMVSPDILRKLSHRQERGTKSVEVIGAGSVGSKIAFSLAKTGDYKFRIIDNGLFRPHNVVRHGMFDPVMHLGLPKAACVVGSISGSAGIEATWAFDDASLTSFKLHTSTDAVVETTGSAAVATNLRSLSISAQLFQVGLYAEGALAFLSAEPKDRSRSVRIDDIESWLFQQGYDNEQIGRYLFEGSEHRRETVGVGCTSLTTVMSDPVLNLQAAALAERLDSYIHFWPAHITEGMGALCLRDPMSGDLKWSRQKLSATEVKYVMVDQVKWQIRVLGSVVAEMRQLRLQAGCNETGGAAIGRIDYLLQTIYVTGVVEPPPSAIKSPSLFEIDYAYLNQVDQDVLTATSGVLRALGTWHSHMDSAKPSQTDRLTFRDLRQSINLPFPVMLVCGGDGLEIVYE